MIADSTRNKTPQKPLGLHYNKIPIAAPCNDSTFTAKKPENRNFQSPVGKVGLARSVKEIGGKAVDRSVGCSLEELKFGRLRDQARPLGRVADASLSSEQFYIGNRRT
jgi:hypothetical protein